MTLRFWQKTQFYGFVGKTQFYDFGGKHDFSFLAENTILWFLRETRLCGLGMKT